MTIIFIIIISIISVIIISIMIFFFYFFFLGHLNAFQMSCIVRLNQSVSVHMQFILVESPQFSHMLHMHHVQPKLRVSAGRLVLQPTVYKYSNFILTQIDTINFSLSSAAKPFETQKKYLAKYLIMSKNSLYSSLYIKKKNPRPSSSLFPLFVHSNTFHILRPTKAPGFVYAWLELISHRIFIARMLAHTPQQKVPSQANTLSA